MSTATTPEIRAQWSDLSASQRLAKAQEFLRGGQKSVADLVGLAGCLKDVDKRFTHVRRLLVRARNHKNFVSETPNTRTKIRQQLPLCTHKDDDLPAGRRLDKAREILQEIAPLEDLGDQERLCLASAIFKRRWETGRDLRHLHRSLAFYLKGHEVAGPGSEGYSGYAGINAAYVLDVIAFEERQASSAAQAIPYRKRSEELRRELMSRRTGCRSGSGWPSPT